MQRDDDDDNDLATRSERSQGSYVPTPEQIRQACAVIQATWSQAERARRAACLAADAWHVPVVAAGADSDA